MRISTKVASAIAALSLMAVPAVAVAGEAPVTPPVGGEEGTDGGEGAVEKPRAIGRDYCREFKASFETHNQFGKCVSAVAHSLRPTPPAKACSGMSHKRQEGQTRSDFSACVKAAAQARKATL